MTDLRARVERLSADQRALLETRLDEALTGRATDASDAIGGHTTLVAYVEPSGSTAPSTDALRRLLLTSLPDYMVPAQIVLLESLPRTRTGKIDRRALPNPTRETVYERPETTAPATAAEQVLAGIWAEVLGFDEVGIHDDFFEMGGDSLLSIRIIARAHKAGLRIIPSEFFDNPTVAGVAAIAKTTTAAALPDGGKDGPAPLTPIQHWFFDLELPDPQHWNQAIVLDVPPGTPPDLIERAWNELVAHHDALRLRFTRTDAGWTQTVAPAGETRLRLVPDLTADALHAGLDLAQAPLLRIASVPDGLLVVAHHLLVDAVSWGTLREDFESACESLRAGRAVALSRTASFSVWARELMAHAQTDAAVAEQEWWLAQTAGGDVGLPADFTDGVNEVRTAESIRVTLSRDVTNALLRDVHEAYRARVSDALLTALAQAFARWSGQRSLVLDMEGHGRGDILDHVDVSRTVGWFTTVFPVRLELPDGTDNGAALRAIKEQVRRIPNRGCGHGILRHLRHDAALRHRLSDLPRPEVLFNYLGHVATEVAAPGRARSPRGLRPYALEINARVSDECFEAVWTFSPNLHRRETVEALAQHFVESLAAIAEHCGAADGGGSTPSDFPMAGVDQMQLDRISALLDDEG